MIPQTQKKKDEDRSAKTTTMTKPREKEYVVRRQYHVVNGVVEWKRNDALDIKQETKQTR